MNISKMTAQEKSIKLLHLLGVRVECTNKQNAIWSVMLGDDAIATDVCPRGLRPEFAHWQHVLKTVSPNLYDEKNMALAWRVLNWGAARLDLLDWWDMFAMPTERAEVAQMAWLDRILELAIEAGMIE